jgi:hypothetical protein
MAGKRKRFIVAGAVVAVLATAISFSFLVRTPWLVLSNAHTGALLLRQRVSEGDEFSVSFIHSVNISPVTEIYQIRHDRIVLTAGRG